MQQGRFRTAEREVDARFELAAVTVRSQAKSEAPILFREVKGRQMPVVRNLSGSRARLCDLIGATDGGFCRRRQKLSESRAVIPEAPAQAPDFEEHRLSDLPQITYFAKDVAPYITAGIFLEKEPDSGTPNLSGIGE